MVIGATTVFVPIYAKAKHDPCHSMQDQEAMAWVGHGEEWSQIQWIAPMRFGKVNFLGDWRGY
jgi:hypothetical protein